MQMVKIMSRTFVTDQRIHPPIDHPDFALRFWQRVALTADIDRCWEWQMTPNAQGYGVLGNKGIRFLTHRLSYYLTHGRWPEPCCLHSCDNRICVNPNHLREGTRKDNSLDAWERNRFPDRTGQNAPCAKFTNAEVRMIRERIANGEHIPTLASSVGVQKDTIYKIRRGVVYKDAEAFPNEG